MPTATGRCSPASSSMGPRSTANVSAASRNGMSLQSRRGGPMSTVNVTGPPALARIAVPSMSSVSLSPLPVSPMNQATQRVPLPQAPAREPSWLKILTLASKPGRAASESTIICSKARSPSQSLFAMAPVMTGVRPRSSTTRMELPMPFILAKGSMPGEVARAARQGKPGIDRVVAGPAVSEPRRVSPS